MPKPTELPKELREFNRIFQQLEYRHNSAEVWKDFLDLFIKQFSFDDCEELNQDIQQRYSQTERHVFGELIQESLKTINEQIKADTDWYDMFGTFYEVLGFTYKRKGFNQYFTPAYLVDLMTVINANDKELTGKGLLVGDPACGSGRMLISFQAHYPGNFLIGQDLDMICCKMTILNMIIHGAKGEVVWGDSLNPEDFKGGWRIVPYYKGIPHVYAINKAESLTYQIWMNKKAKALTDTSELKETKPSISSMEQPVQLEFNFQ